MTVAVGMSNGQGGPSPARCLGTTWAESTAEHEGKKKKTKKRAYLVVERTSPEFKGSVKSRQF